MIRAKAKGQLEHGRRKRRKNSSSHLKCALSASTCTSHFHLLRKQKKKKKLRRSKSLLSNKQKTTAHSLLSILSARVHTFSVIFRCPNCPNYYYHTPVITDIVAALSLFLFLCVSVTVVCGFTAACLAAAWIVAIANNCRRTHWKGKRELAS